MEKNPLLKACEESQSQQQGSTAPTGTKRFLDLGVKCKLKKKDNNKKKQLFFFSYYSNESGVRE